MRAKEIFESMDDKIRYVAEGIAGIGPSRAISLLKHFKTIRNLSNASIEELAQVEGIGKITALKIFQVLNSAYQEV